MRDLRSRRFALLVLVYFLVLVIIIALASNVRVARDFERISNIVSDIGQVSYSTEDNYITKIWQPGDSIESVIEANSGPWGGVLRQVFNLSEEIQIPAEIVKVLGAEEAIERCYEIIRTYCYWIEFSETMHYKGNNNADGSLTIRYAFRYYQNAKEMQVRFETEASRILEGAEGRSLPRKLLFFNEWLVDNVNYERIAAYGEGQSAYEAIIMRNSVCAGYTRAFQILATAAGAESYYISGISRDENHAWNLVVINGGEYFFDVTWNDVPISWYVYVLNPAFLKDDSSLKNKFVFLSREDITESHTDWAAYGDLSLLERRISVW